MPLQEAAVTKTAKIHESTTTPMKDALREDIQECLDSSELDDGDILKEIMKKNLFLGVSMLNVAQADLMARANDETKGRDGGRSVVTIRNKMDPSKRVVKEAFVDKVASAMCILFDCKCFSVDHQYSVDWNFFGIAKNTISAAKGFETEHNKILDQACALRGDSPSYRLELADGLVSMAHHEKHRESRDVRKALDIFIAREREEANERERELGRLHNLLPMTIDHDGSNLGNIASNESEEPWDERSGHLGPMDVDESDNDMKSTKTEERPKEEAAFGENDRSVIDLTGDADDNIDKFLKQEFPATLDLKNLSTDPAKSESSLSQKQAPQTRMPGIR